MEFIYHNSSYVTYFLQKHHRIRNTKEVFLIFRLILSLKTPCWKVFCHMRTYDVRWYWLLYFGSKLTIACFPIMSCDDPVCYLIFKWWLRPCAFVYRTITWQLTAVLRGLIIVCIKLKIRTQHSFTYKNACMTASFE